MRKKALIGLFLAGSVLLGACAGGGKGNQGSGGSTAGNPGTPAEDTLRIGAAVGETGPLAREGGLLRDGYRIWMEEVNKKGGIKVGNKNYKVEIIFYDDKSDAQTSAKLVEKLVTEDNVKFILGPYSSGITIATAAIGERYKVITMASSASTPKVYQQGYKYLFGMMPPSDIQVKPELELAASLNPRPSTIAIISPDDLFPLVAAEGGQKMAEEMGFKVVYFAKYPKNTQDFAPILSRIKELNPDILIGTGYIPDNIQLTKQMKELRINPKMVVFPTATAVPDFVKALGKDAEGVIGSEDWVSDVKYKDDLFGDAATYATLFKERFGYEPSYINAAATGAARALQIAIERAGSLDVEAVREQLKKLDVELVFGKVKYDEGGMNIAGAYFARQIINGQPKIIWPTTLQQAQPVYPKPTW